MKISMITATYNSEKTIERTIKSLLKQDYIDIEFIIIDGLSSDLTLSIIDRYSKYVTKIISEKDKGIYEALNKGLDLATGDIIGFLHSDDYLNSNDVLSKVAYNFIKHKPDIFIGDILMINPLDKKIVRYYKGSHNPEYFFSMGIMPPHPAVFVTKNTYDKYGKFNLKYRIASDYDFLFRIIVKHRLKYIYLPEILVKMSTGGKSTKSVINSIKLNLEILKIHFAHKYPLNLIKKLFYRFKEVQNGRKL